MKIYYQLAKLVLIILVFHDFCWIHYQRILLWKDGQKFERGVMTSSDTVTLYHPIRLRYQVFQNMVKRNSNSKVNASSLAVNPQKSPTMLAVNLNTSIYSTGQMEEHMFFGG